MLCAVEVFGADSTHVTWPGEPLNMSVFKVNSLLCLVEGITGTVKNGHRGTLQKCPYFGGVLNMEVSLCTYTIVQGIIGTADSCPHCGGFCNRGSPFSEVPL